MNVLSKKNSFWRLLVVLVLFSSWSFIRADDDAHADAHADDFIIDIDQQIDEYEKMFKQPCDPDNNTPPNPDNVLMALAVIKSPLWKHTMAPVGRDILYLLPHKITALEYGGIACNLFFNMTNRMQVDAGNLLQVEGAIDQELLNSFLEIYFQNASPEDISGLIPLFKKMTIQERKGGLLVQGGFNRGPFTIQVNTSLQFSERNFWLDKQDQQDVKELIQRITGQEGALFDEREGYRIKYGMGDTRVKFGVNTINMTSIQMDVGLETILPTSRFSHTHQLKSKLGNIENVDELQDSAVSILKSVRDYLIDPRLGGGNFGVGCYLESKIGLFHDVVQMWMRLSYDKFSSRREDRLIMFKQVLQPSDIKGAMDSKNPAFKTEFIENFLMQYVFPPSFNVTVQPGGVLNFVTSMSVDFSKRWRYALGYDFYAQQQEHIRKIHKTCVSFQDLRIEDAESDSASQHKIFSELMYYLKKRDYADMSIGLGGDVTIASKGIGRDWTVYFKFAASF